MENLTEEQKQELADLAESGTKIKFVAYNPVTTVGDPEADATADGYVEYYREDTANLVEVIYTSA